MPLLKMRPVMILMVLAGLYSACEPADEQDAGTGGPSPSATSDSPAAKQPGEIEGRVVTAPYPWDNPSGSVGAFEIEVATDTSHARPGDTLRVILGSEDVPITCAESDETATLDDVAAGEIVAVVPVGEGVDPTDPPAVGAASVTVPCEAS